MARHFTALPAFTTKPKCLKSTLLCKENGGVHRRGWPLLTVVREGMSLGSSTLTDTVEDLSQWGMETQAAMRLAGQIWGWGLPGIPRGHCTSDDCLLHLYLWLTPSLAGGRDDKGRQTFKETLKLLVNSRLVHFLPVVSHLGCHHGESHDPGSAEQVAASPRAFSG